VTEFDLLSTAADGMGVQRAMLDVAARNVAAAQASSPTHPFPRLVAQFAPRNLDDAFEPDRDDDAVFEPGRDPVAAFDPGGDAIAAFDPGRDDDDAAGMRFVGSVPGGETADSLTEMIAVLNAQRAYEANASVFDVGKRLAERTIDVGR
jgi:flagellar basal-body rod protein FlgC